MDRHAAQDVLDLFHQAQNEYYAGGDQAALERLLTEDVQWSVPGDDALAGVYVGLAEVLGYMQRQRRIVGCTLRLVRRDVLVGRGRRIAALTDGIALRSGQVHRWETMALYEIADARIRRCWLLPIDSGEHDAIWS